MRLLFCSVEWLSELSVQIEARDRRFAATVVYGEVTVGIEVVCFVRHGS
jgi:hypothetical protein